MQKPSPGRRSQLYAACPQAQRPQTGWNQSLMTLTPNYLTSNQSGKCPWADHTLLLEHYKIPYYPLGGGIVFEALACYVPLFAWQLILLFLFPGFFCLFLVFGFFGFFCLFRATSPAYGGSQARDSIGILCHSNSSVGSEPHLRPTPQVMAMLDPWPTKGGQGPNPHHHGS